MNNPLDRFALTFTGRAMEETTFLLGNGGGFVLYLPAARNERDRTLQGTKWFGASGFGRSFLESILVEVQRDGTSVGLNRTTQTSFVMHLDRAVRTYSIGGTEITETFFVPDDLQAVVLTLQGDVRFHLTPQFDMRYYQSFNTDFSHYSAEESEGGLFVCNQVEDVGVGHETMRFFGLIGDLGGGQIAMLPESERLVEKTYLRDEHRRKLVQSAYKEAQATGPDEAPIWDLDSTKVYMPARITAEGPVTLICAFGDTREEAAGTFGTVTSRLPALRREKRERIAARLEEGRLQTGNAEIDTAYAHVLTRFMDCLVARDVTLHVDPVHRGHFYGIFAGNKYFMDAWKRDENISLEALLATNQFETAGHILNDTWQQQDERTGRLPHIIRAGEPLVYYSSDGTLWALRRLAEYTRMSGDRTLLDSKLPMVRHFFAASMNFVQRGLLPSGGIIDPHYLWETWEDTPYTPRAGFPVEIEQLWLNALECYLPWLRPVDSTLAATMEATLVEGKETFHEMVLAGWLADSLSYDWKPDSTLTPNGYIGFGLGFSLPPGVAAAMVPLARDQFCGRRGIRSLAPRDWSRVFPSAFLDDPHLVRGKDMASVGIYNYHRGIEWEWLTPFFVAAELAHGSPDDAFRRYLRGQVHETLHEVGIGGLSELYALQGQVGADFQAWSMAGFIVSLGLFAGVEVDALERTVRVEPLLPADWSSLAARRRVGTTRFDVLVTYSPDAVPTLEVRPLDPVPAGYTLHLALPVSPHVTVRGVSLNGAALPPHRWTDSGTATEGSGRAIRTVCSFAHTRLTLSLEA